MRLEDRMRQSIRHHSGTVVLRSDLAALGSPAQVTHALATLLHKGELLRLAPGIYAKATREFAEGPVRPQESLETIIRETADKLGLILHGIRPPGVSGETGKVVILVETETPRISRHLLIAGKQVQFRSHHHQRRGGTRSIPLPLPTTGVARFVQDLARSYKVVYTVQPMDQWAETVTRLAGDDVRADDTENLLIALKRAGKISTKDVATLTINYLRERKQSVRSIQGL